MTGGAGIATGLPDNFRRAGLLPRHEVSFELRPVEGPVAVIAGSSSAATREQVRRFAGSYPALKLDLLDGDVDALAARAVEALDAGAVLVYSTAPPDEVARVQERLGAEVEARLVVEPGPLAVGPDRDKVDDRDRRHPRAECNGGDKSQST